jgi:hypothetical protein
VEGSVKLIPCRMRREGENHHTPNVGGEPFIYIANQAYMEGANQAYMEGANRATWKIPIRHTWKEQT